MAESTSTKRVRDALRLHGLDDAVREMPDSTRTARDAATAVGCEVAQIVKSLLFVAKDGQATLVLTSGGNRVDPARLAEELGTQVRMADPAAVRSVTGFSIGGVAPVGLTSKVPVLIDQDLMGFPQVWAAAGTARAVFPVAPDDLQRITGARVVQVTGTP